MSPQLLDAEWERLERVALKEADRKFTDYHDKPGLWSPLEEIKYVRLIEKVHGLFCTDLTGVA